jgi:hypothetical protein
MLFCDSDRLYLYWGLGMEGIFGMELDTNNPVRALTAPKRLISFHSEHVWERLGNWNQNKGLSFIEGSWMVRVKERYYLVYSAPGTFYHTYAFGVYRSDSPLGEFHYQENSPILMSRHGLITGTGHGCIVEGPMNTLWAFYTIAMCYATRYERRIGFDPAGVDEDGNLYVSPVSELPQWAPGVLEHPEAGNSTQLLPLTCGEPVSASSCAPGRDALYAVDESLLSWWQPSPEDKEAALTVELRAEYAVSAIRLIWRDVNLDYDNGILPGPFQYKVNATQEKEPVNFVTILDMSENKIDNAVDYQTFPTVHARYVQLVITGMPEKIQPGVINFTAFGTYAGE